MQVMFQRWCVDPKGRTLISVDPKRVDCTEHYSDAFRASPGPTEEDFPPATRIIMKGKQEYLVQGSLPNVVDKLNAT
jgi:hypothetical protein